MPLATRPPATLRRQGRGCGNEQDDGILSSRGNRHLDHSWYREDIILLAWIARDVDGPVDPPLHCDAVPSFPYSLSLSLYKHPSAGRFGSWVNKHIAPVLIGKHWAMMLVAPFACRLKNWLYVWRRSIVPRAGLVDPYWRWHCGNEWRWWWWWRWVLRSTWIWCRDVIKMRKIHSAY